MIPMTRRDVQRFTPEGRQGEEGAPVYLIGVPTVAGRAKLRGALVAAGLRWWRPTVFYDAAREWLEQVQPANLDELLALIARVESDGGALVPADAGTSEEDTAEINRRVEDAGAWAELLEVLSQQSPQMAKLAADNLQYMALAPYVAASLFLRGWENAAVPFKREPDQTVSIELLGELPADDIRAIGIEVTKLLEPSGAQRKNYEPPSSSSASPTPSAAEPKRQTAVPGTSSAKSTRATRA